MAINKKTRVEIVKLLLRRRKALGQKVVDPISLIFDLEWIKGHIGMIMDELIDAGVVKDKPQ